MTRARSRDGVQATWPTAAHVLGVVAGALVLSSADRARILKGRQVQRLLRGDLAGKVSTERVVEILRAMVRRFLMDDPLVLRLVVPSDEELAAWAGFSTVGELYTACGSDAGLATFVRGAQDRAPIDCIVRSLLEHMSAWDQFLDHFGQLRCRRAPWLRGQLRIAVVEIAVFYGYLAFKMKLQPTTAPPEWCCAVRDDKTLRQLLRNRGVSRQRLAEHLGRLEQTKTKVDRWCDKGCRPSDAHLEKIADILEKEPEARASIRQTLRRHFALRDLAKQLGKAIGMAAAQDHVRAFHRLAATTYDRLAATRVRADMHAAICDGVLSDHMRSAPSASIVDHLLRVEEARTWRATLRAMRSAPRRAVFRPDRFLAYPRPPLLTELTDAASSDLFVEGPDDRRG